MPILQIRDGNGNFAPIPAIKGKSAYEQAVEGGYEGTEADFIVALNAFLKDETHFGLAYYTTEGTGSAYTVTIPGITELKAGTVARIIPHVASGSVRPTLDVNGLGAKDISRYSSIQTSGAALLFSGGTETWLGKGAPVELVYNGRGWIAAELPKPHAYDLYGEVPVANGGTGGTTTEEALINLGAVAKAGDAMAGDLIMTKADYPQIRMEGANLANQGLVETTTDRVGMIIRNDREVGWANSRLLELFSSDKYSDIRDALYLSGFNDGNYFIHRIYGEHNKPANSYTGNGSATARTIETGGIGSCILIWRDSYFSIVTPIGGIICKTANSGAGTTVISDSAVKFVAGTLTLTTTQDAFNADGKTYSYQVL